MKTLLSIFILIILLSSCSGNKFVSRKYTQGRFIENSKAVKHNTLFTDSNKNFANKNCGANILFKTSLKESIIEKELIAKAVNSIIKKDSIYIIQKRGHDQKIVIKNNLPNVTVIIKKEKIKTVKPVDPHKEILKQGQLENKIDMLSILALSCSLIPVAGFIIALSAKKQIKKYRNHYYDDEKNSEMVMANIALGISIIPSLAVALVAIAIIILFLFLLFTVLIM